jgi:hypothetical protein
MDSAAYTANSNPKDTLTEAHFFQKPRIFALHPNCRKVVLSFCPVLSGSAFTAFDSGCIDPRSTKRHRRQMQQHQDNQ